MVLTSFGRVRRMTERSATKLPQPPDVLELDVKQPPEPSRPSRPNLRERWGRVDGVLHAIAFAPEDALGGNFLNTAVESAEVAFRTSAYSLKALSVALADLFPEEGEHRRARLDASVAWPVYDSMGVAKGRVRGHLALPGARPRTARRAREPGRRRPARHARRARRTRIRRPRRRLAPAGPARLGHGRSGPVAGAIVFLLSDLARAITGEILHVDGGFHAMGTALTPVLQEATA